MNYTDILTQIRKIIRSVNLESKRIEKEYGISIPQLLCLNYLNGRDDYKATHKELKDYQEFLLSLKNTKKIKEKFKGLTIEDQKKELK